MKADLVKLHAEGRILAHQIAQAENDACRLRDDGRQRCRPHAETEHAEKQPVQKDVEQRGKNEVVEGAAAVAEGVHDAAADVVEHQKQCAEKIVAEILDRLGQHLGIHVHPDEKGGGKCHARRGEQHAAEESAGKIGVDGVGHAFVLSCAEVTGNDNACADGNALEKADHQEDQIARGGDGGKGIGT